MPDNPGSALANLRWAKATKAQKRAAASHAGSSISPKAATARAKKAWRTKRRKAKQATKTKAT